MDNNKLQLNEQFADFKGKKVLISLKNSEEYEGTVVTIDNFLNTVIEEEEKLRVVKGGEITFISMKE